jgi:hypothetical protein
MTETEILKAVQNVLLHQFSCPIENLNIDGDTFTFQADGRPACGLINIRRFPERRIFGFTSEFIRTFREMECVGPWRFLIILDEEKPLWNWNMVSLNHPWEGKWEYSPMPSVVYDECDSATILFNFEKKHKQ